MSTQEYGSYTFLSGLEGVSQHITRYEPDNIDCIIYWDDSTTISSVYLNADDWTNPHSSKVSYSVGPNVSVRGNPRNFPDTLNTYDKWAIWPHTETNGTGHNLNIVVTNINGSNDTSVFSNYIYHSAFSQDEELVKLSPTFEGIMAVIRSPTSDFSLRLFTYTGDPFDATSVDVTTTTVPIVSNFSTTFPPTSMISISRYATYVLYIEDGTSQTRLTYVDTDVVGDTASFVVVANTNTGLPETTSIEWGNSSGGIYGVVSFLLSNGNDLSLLITDTDGSNPAVTTLAITGDPARRTNRKIMNYSADYSFYYMAAKNYIGMVNHSTNTVVSENTTFSTTDAIVTDYNGSVTVIGINGTTIYGTNASDPNSMGETTVIGNVASEISSIGYIQGTPIGANFFMKSSDGITVIKEEVTSAPPLPVVIDYYLYNGMSVTVTSGEDKTYWYISDETKDTLVADEGWSTLTSTKMVLFYDNSAGTFNGCTRVSIRGSSGTYNLLCAGLRVLNTPGWSPITTTSNGKFKIVTEDDDYFSATYIMRESGFANAFFSTSYYNTYLLSKWPLGETRNIEIYKPSKYFVDSVSATIVTRDGNWKVARFSSDITVTESSTGNDYIIRIIS